MVFLFKASLVMAQVQPAAMRLNTVLTLDASRISEFDAHWASVQAWAEENAFPFYTPQSESGNKRLLTSIIRGHADIDVLVSLLERAVASEEKDLKQSVRILQSIVQSHFSYVTRYDFDLSYSPPGSYVGGFHHMETCRFQSENRSAVEQAIKDYGALWQASGQSSAFHITWIGLGGLDLGFEMRKSAKTAKERRALDYHLTQTLDAEKTSDIEAQLYSLCDTVQTTRWTARPDLLITMPKK
jgi:hypothetical protein